MKQCDRVLSPFVIGSSSLSFAASESDPEKICWRDFSFDFSFLTSDDQKTGLDDDSLSNLSRHADATTLPKEESERYCLIPNALGRKGDFAGPVRDQRSDLEIRRVENSDSFLKLPNILESNLKCADSQPRISPSLAVISTSHFDSNGTTIEGPPTASVLRVTSITPLAKSAAVANTSGDTEAEGQRPDTKDKDINESNSSPSFSKIPKLLIKKCSSGSGIDKLNLRTVLTEKAYIPADQVDTEVDSPCWRGIQSHDAAAIGTKSWNFRRCLDERNGLHRLNPLAPQFIPSSARKNIDNNGKEFEENSYSSLKRALSSTFPPSSGDFSITNPSEAGIEQDSGQNNRLGILIHDADESLGIVSQDSVSKTMSILDIINQFQTPKKLDPLAPVFVPANAKLSTIVHGNHSAIETNTCSNSAFSFSDILLQNSVKTDRYSSEADTSFRNQYSDSGHESGTTYAFNAQLGSQVQISDNTKVDSSSNMIHGQKKLNPLAPQFSLADTKQNVYGSEKNQPAKVNSSILFSPIGYRNHKELHAGLAQSSMHVEPSFNEVDTKQMGPLHPNILHGNSSLKSQPTKENQPFHILGTAVSASSSGVKGFFDSGQRYGCSTSSPSPKMDVKKLLTTIHGLSELLMHVHGSESSNSPNEQDLDLINCAVQNLNSYINNRVQEHIGNYASAVHSSYDSKLLPKMLEQSLRDHQLPKAQNMTYTMVSEEMVPESHFDYGVGKVIGNHQTEEPMNPNVLFYRSLWLKAKADKYLMEYETLLSETRNLSN